MSVVTVPVEEKASQLTEEQITREVILLIAELHPLEVCDGRIVIPPDAPEDLAARIRKFEGELLWAQGFESGPRWGCSNVPARTPVPVIERSHRKQRRRV